jgi:hypothetical protein
MALSLDAVYQSLVSEIAHTRAREITHSFETIPLAVKHQACELMKEKFLSKLIPTASTPLDEVAYRTFVDFNERSARWTLPTFGSSGDEQMWGEFSKIVEDFFLCDLGPDVELTYGNIALNARCGPGAAKLASNGSHYGKLYSGQLSAGSQEIVDMYKADINLWPEESNAENIRQENFGSIVVSPGSTSSFVPKSAKTSRMISVEPTLNMFYQLGIGEIISKRLKRYFGIDLATQPSINRYLAFIGSRVDSSFGDGFATIDLSSASDSLSLQLCGQILPQEWFSTLVEFRSPFTTGSVGREKFHAKLNMMSTMGNGFTFPLQTALFACAASACISMDDQIRSCPKAFTLGRPGTFSVFGDDIIVPAKNYARMLRLLEFMGCSPNKDKSFSTGSFRESCGHDYYRGYNIRPVFLRKWENESDLVVLVNLLVDWSARTEIFIPNTLRLLVGAIKHPNIVPRSEGMDSGIRVPYSIAMDFRRLGVRRNAPTQSWVYTKRYPHQKRVRILDGHIHVPAGTRRQIYNPSGLFVSYLLGEIRGGSIGLRSNKAIYRTKRAVTPNWDYCVTTLEDQLIGSESLASLTKRVTYILQEVLSECVVTARARARGASA